MSNKEYLDDSPKFSEGSQDLDRTDGVEISFGPRRRRALIRRIDTRLIPMIILFYFMSFLDRTNVANALTLGIQKDLKLHGNQPNVALAVFYVPYVIFELPSNYFLKKFTPRIWLSTCVCSFGIVMLCHGFVHSYAGLLAARFMLGLTECGILPGCSYLLSMWYTPPEALKRFVIFFNSTTLSGAFGSLIAGGIAKMQGVRGYEGWRWLFIIEGIVTILIGLGAFLTAPNFIEDAEWLSKEEKQYLCQRVETDSANAGGENHALSYREALKRYFTDYKSYIAGLAYFGGALNGYSIAYFLPTIVKGFQYSVVQTQLHSVPPFAVGWVWSVSTAFISARVGHPLGFILLSSAIAIGGTGILFCVHTNISAEYAALFLITLGVYGAVPVYAIWYIMNLRGSQERSIGTAWMIGFGNLGGIAATFSFQSNDAPYYKKGYTIFFFGACLAAVGSAAYGLSIFIENKRATEETQKKRLAF